MLFIAGVIAAFDGVDFLAEGLRILIEFAGGGVDRLAGAGYVEHAQFLDLPEKVFRVVAQEQERVFGHFGDHASSSSSSW